MDQLRHLISSKSGGYGCKPAQTDVYISSWIEADSSSRNHCFTTSVNNLSYDRHEPSAFATRSLTVACSQYSIATSEGRKVLVTGLRAHGSGQCSSVRHPHSNTMPDVPCRRQPDPAESMSNDSVLCTALVPVGAEAGKDLSPFFGRLLIVAHAVDVVVLSILTAV